MHAPIVIAAAVLGIGDCGWMQLAKLAPHFFLESELVVDSSCIYNLAHVVFAFVYQNNNFGFVPGPISGKLSVHDSVPECSTSSSPGVQWSAGFPECSTSSSLGVQQSAGYPKNTPRIVGIFLVPSVNYIISVLSVLRCGEAFVPLDPSWPKERILSIVSSSEADLIIGCSLSIDGIYSHELDKSHWFVNCSSRPILLISAKDNLEEHAAPSQLAWPCESERPSLFCYLMYTSGSTGKPKGVCGTEPGSKLSVNGLQDFDLSMSCFPVFKVCTDRRTRTLSPFHFKYQFANHKDKGAILK
ncbi:hypothetical protein RJ640_025748 [Escallonia rubra]|uniref:AMP-dependent synthetase/ligase domain-containing protein n=1 Tax=Escallonia rubra TaxID=112253 RepID=A0AA88RT02_9ASTE|nr:hypothetical protein RJ640_025748 [Escallonia rubra]